MSSPQIVYSHLKEVRDFKISKILKKATIIDSAYTISKVVGVLINSNSYDVFCMDGKNVLTIYDLPVSFQRLHDTELLLGYNPREHGRTPRARDQFGIVLLVDRVTR